MRGVAWLVAFVAACSSGCADDRDSAAGAQTSTVPVTAAMATDAVVTTTTSSVATVAPSVVPSTTAATDPPASRPPGLMCTPAPDDATSIVTGPDWIVGASRQLQMEDGRSGSGQSVGGLTITPVVLDVLASEPSTVGLAWRAGRGAPIAGTTTSDAAAISEVLADLPTTDILYTLDGAGAFVGVENIEEQRAALIDTIDALADHGAIPDDVHERLRTAYDQLGDQQIGQVVSEPMQLFHALDGLTLEVGERIELDDLVPNALGGEPFAAVTTIELVQMVDEDGCVAIERHTVPDPDHVSQMLLESIAEQGMLPDQVSIEDGTDGLEVEMVIRAQYDYESGRLRQIRSTQRVSLGAEVSTRTLIIHDETDD